MKAIRLATQMITKEQNKWINKRAKATEESRATVIRNLIQEKIESQAILDMCNGEDNE